MNKDIVTQFYCSYCKQHKTHKCHFSTGYSRKRNNHKVCYECRAIQDKKDMVKNGRIVLYMTVDAKYNSKISNYGDCKITNWPGTLSFPARYKKGRHNMTGTRYDVWFHFNGHEWHGRILGENTQLCHCRQTKQQVKRK